MKQLLLCIGLCGLTHLTTYCQCDTSKKSELSVIITNSIPQYGAMDVGFFQVSKLCDKSTVSLVEACTTSFETIESFEHLGHVNTITLQTSDLQLYLEVSGAMDDTDIQSKNKTSFAIRKFKQVIDINHYYRGELVFTPKAYLYIKLPSSQALVDRIEVPLDEYSVSIENTEGTWISDIGGVLTIDEEVVGITDVIDDMLQDCSNDIQTELERILSGESLESIVLKYTTLTNK